MRACAVVQKAVTLGIRWAGVRWQRQNSGHERALRGTRMVLRDPAPDETQSVCEQEVAGVRRRGTSGKSRDRSPRLLAPWTCSPSPPTPSSPGWQDYAGCSITSLQRRLLQAFRCRKSCARLPKFCSSRRGIALRAASAASLSTASGSHSFPPIIQHIVFPTVFALCEKTSRCRYPPGITLGLQARRIYQPARVVHPLGPAQATSSTGKQTFQDDSKGESSASACTSLGHMG